MTITIINHWINTYSRSVSLRSQEFFSFSLYISRFTDEDDLPSSIFFSEDLVFGDIDSDEFWTFFSTDFKTSDDKTFSWKLLYDFDVETWLFFEDNFELFNVTVSEI